MTLVAGTIDLLSACQSVPKPRPMAVTESGREQETTQDCRLAIDPVNAPNAQIVVFWIDTDGLDFWPGSCGPEHGYEVCPDYLTVLGREQQVQGLKLQGERQSTLLGAVDEGELFTFTGSTGDAQFRAAKQALAEGVLHVQIRSMPTDLKTVRVKAYGVAVPPVGKR